MLHFSRVKSHIKLVISMLLYNSSFFVAHANIVSIYDLQSMKWTQNITFKDPVMKLVRQAGCVLAIFKDTTFE